MRERGKPSSGSGTLGCNSTYAHNIGVEPHHAIFGKIDGPGLVGFFAGAWVGMALTSCLRARLAPGSREQIRKTTC